MRVISPTPTPPPMSLAKKLAESPTPCRYFDTCTTLRSAALRVRSCSFASWAVSGASTPDRLRNNLNTLLAVAFWSSVSTSPGPFQVPSAQNTMFLLMMLSAAMTLSTKHVADVGQVLASPELLVVDEEGRHPENPHFLGCA